MAVTIELKNVTVKDGWVEGDVVVSVSGINASKHFKTKDNVDIDLGSGFRLIGNVTVEPPNACIAGKVTTPLGIEFPINKQCFPAAIH